MIYGTTTGGYGLRPTPNHRWSRSSAAYVWLRYYATPLAAWRNHRRCVYGAFRSSSRQRYINKTRPSLPDHWTSTNVVYACTVPFERLLCTAFFICSRYLETGGISPFCWYHLKDEQHFNDVVSALLISRREIKSRTAHYDIGSFRWPHESLNRTQHAICCRHPRVVQCESHDGETSLTANDASTIKRQRYNFIRNIIMPFRTSAFSAERCFIFFLWSKFSLSV